MSSAFGPEREPGPSTTPAADSPTAPSAAGAPASSAPHGGPTGHAAALTATGAPVGAKAEGPGGLIERAGIEIIQESERTAKPRDLFWPWFAANVSVFGMSYGTWLLGFGISFWQALIVGVIGIVVSFALCGLVAIAGKRGSAPTMVLSRAAFGVNGQKLPGIISWLTSMGWETMLAIAAVLATATVFQALGLAHGTPVLILATLVIAGIIVGASVLGYHTIMRIQSLLTWATGAMTIVFMALTVTHIDWARVSQLPQGSPQAMIGALVMMMTGMGLGWINIAADWSRYQKRSASDGAIIAWNTIGGSAAPLILVTFGLLLAGSDPSVAEGIGQDPVGTLVSLLPTWALIPFWIVAVLTLVSGAVNGIYSSGLTLLSLGIKVPRPVAAFIDGTILTIGTVYVVFFAKDFQGPFTAFLITLGVPIAAWAGILIADVVCRRQPYDEAALFDPRGRYGSIDWASVITFLGLTGLGWGFVVNPDPVSAPWLDWMGFLLKPLGLGEYVADGAYWEGPWAYSNLGLLIALVLGFVITLAARFGKIRRQERDQLADAESSGLVGATNCWPTERA